MSEKTIQLLFHNNYFIGTSENHPSGQFSDIQLYQFQSVPVRVVGYLRFVYRVRTIEELL